MSLKHVIIVGGGLAGLTSAIHLSRSGLKVTLVEKQGYPRHKVCGEYVSNEVSPYLKELGLDPFILGAKRIVHFELSSVKGVPLRVKLPLGGFSLSRFTFDFELLKKARSEGVEVIIDTVKDICFENDRFYVGLKEQGVKEGIFVIGAFGKRSNLDQKLHRNFLKKKSPYLAVKAHYSGEYPENLVGLHHFYGGYCGVSNVENGQLNICYIAEYKEFKKVGNLEDFQNRVLSKNQTLKTILDNSQIQFDKPLTISQISFDSKGLIDRHVLMCGDSAGMIHPLCGNGMSMAILGAKIASELILRYFEGDLSRADVEREYKRQWNRSFRLRITAGRWLVKLFRMKSLSLHVMSGLKKYPGLLLRIIRMTHGTSMEGAWEI